MGQQAESLGDMPQTPCVTGINDASKGLTMRREILTLRFKPKASSPSLQTQAFKPKPSSPSLQAQAFKPEPSSPSVGLNARLTIRRSRSRQRMMPTVIGDCAKGSTRQRVILATRDTA